MPDDQQDAANVLLSFPNVRNAPGDGNDVFDHAVRTATASAVATGVPASLTAFDIGKKLHKPTVASEPRRLGVCFTQAEHAEIKALHDAGDTLAAQRLILSIIDGQVS